MEPGAKGAATVPDAALIPITAPEVRRLLTRLVWTENQLPDFILSWSCCPGRGGEGATKPEPANAITNAACQICDCSTSEEQVQVLAVSPGISGNT